MESTNDVLAVNDMLAKFIDETDATLKEIKSRLDVIEQRQVIGFKELGLDINKVKVPSRRVLALGVPGAFLTLLAAASLEPNLRHVSQSADPIDWSSVDENDAVNAGKALPEDIEEAKARLPQPAQDGEVLEAKAVYQVPVIHVGVNAEIVPAADVASAETVAVPVQHQDQEAPIEG